MIVLSIVDFHWVENELEMLPKKSQSDIKNSMLENGLHLDSINPGQKSPVRTTANERQALTAEKLINTISSTWGMRLEEGFLLLG